MPRTAKNKTQGNILNVKRVKKFLKARRNYHSTWAKLIELSKFIKGNHNIHQMMGNEVPRKSPNNVTDDPTDT